MGHRLRIANPAKNRRAQREARNCIRLDGPYADLEAYSLALQRFVARLQDADVYGLTRCSIYFTPLDRSGNRRAITDSDIEPKP